MNKYTFLLNRTQFSSPVEIVAVSESAAREILELNIQNDVYDFSEDEYYMELYSSESSVGYTPMAAVTNPMPEEVLTGYTPMSAVRSTTQEATQQSTAQLDLTRLTALLSDCLSVLQGRSNS